MFSLPLPFVISLLLVMLMIRIAFSRGSGSFRPLLFVAACTLLVTLVGFRWAFDVSTIRLLQPAMASVLPPLAWWCFASIRHQSPATKWPMLIPLAFVALTALSSMGWPVPIDPALVVLYLAYGLALCRTALRGADNFFTVRLSDAAKTQKSVLFAGCLLCFSGLSDTFIGLDFAFFHGVHAAIIVTLANMMVLPLLALTVAVTHQNVIAPRPNEETVAAVLQTDELQLVERIKTLIRDKSLFLDPDLTLDRLSRKAMIPSRQISQAVNRVLNCNVSQLVNSFRVEEACRLLSETDLPVTTLLFDSGFRTKSNFNREFLRQTGMNPGDYRRTKATAQPEPETR